MSANEILFILVHLVLLPLMISSLRMVGLVVWISTTAVFGAATFAPEWLRQVLIDIGF